MKQIKSIIELAPKPSDALNAMVRGLLKASRRKTFNIDMSSFGEIRDGICFGCAATCTIQELSGVAFKPSSGRLERDTRADLIGYANPLADITYYDLMNFEHAINSFRCGSPRDLIDYYKIPLPDIEQITGHDLYMCDHNWEEQIPVVRTYIKHLEKMGL